MPSGQVFAVNNPPDTPMAIAPSNLHGRRNREERLERCGKEEGGGTRGTKGRPGGRLCSPKARWLEKRGGDGARAGRPGSLGRRSSGAAGARARSEASLAVGLADPTV